MQAHTWITAGLGCGLVAAAVATVYLVNRPAPPAPTQRTQSVIEQPQVLPRPVIDRNKKARKMIAQLERDGYRCIEGQLFRKEGNEWKQLGNCPRVR
jgi:hypothetical protein